MSLDMFIRLVKTSDEIDCVMDLKLDGDLFEVLGLQTNVTVLKVKVKARVLNIGSQLVYRSSLSLKSFVFCIVDVVIEFI